MVKQGYKKYMKPNSQTEDYTLVKLFLMVFFGMLLVFTFLIKSFSPSVDVSIGDYKHDSETEQVDDSSPVDGRLAMIQDEDRSKSFSELMEKAEEIERAEEQKNEVKLINEQTPQELKTKETFTDPVYKVFVGSYSSAEQAKVAKDIILDTGININPIVKCIGTNNYTLQVGSFKSKSSADAMLSTVQMNHLPGRIVQEY